MEEVELEGGRREESDSLVDDESVGFEGRRREISFEMRVRGEEEAIAIETE